VLWCLSALAIAGTVTLDVGVHRDAGSAYDLAADGAAGQCSVGSEWIACPADGPVTFRWGPGGSWQLTGDTVLEPGERGVAWVLGPHQPMLEQLLHPATATPQSVRDATVRRGDHVPPPPSFDVVEQLIALLDHPDKGVRRAAVEGLSPWVAGTPMDFLPIDAPNPLPAGIYEQLAGDPDVGVRRRLVWMLRDLRPNALTDEARMVLAHLLLDPHQGIRRAAIASLASASKQDFIAPDLAWRRAIERVPLEEGPGRAACNTLAKLHGDVEDVDADSAVELVLTHHPERAWRVWSAWREEVAFDAIMAERLLRHTVGMDRKLLRHWSDTHPADLALVIARWEPAAPHSERYALMATALDATTDEQLRDVLGLGPMEASYQAPPGPP
jgi:hypothetical protein